MVLDFTTALLRRRETIGRVARCTMRLTISLGSGASRTLVTLGKREEMDFGNYNPAKAAQMIAFFALKAKDRAIDLLKAMKLVYLSDRDSIGRWGEPILSEPRVAMKFGPVNDLTYAFAKGEHRDPDGWSRFLQDIETAADKRRTLRVRPGVGPDDLDELSEADIESLEAVWNRVGFMQPFALAGWTHKDGNVPEWTDPQGSSRPIPLECIMREVGISDAAERAAQVEGYRSIAEILREP